MSTLTLDTKITSLTLDNAVRLLDLCLDKFDSRGGDIADNHDEALRNAVLNKDTKGQKKTLKALAKDLEKAADDADWFKAEYELDARLFIANLVVLAKMI